MKRNPDLSIRIIDVSEMDARYNPVVIMEVRRRDGSVICGPSSGDFKTLVRVPADAYDFFARRGIYPTIEELKNCRPQ